MKNIKEHNSESHTFFTYDFDISHLLIFFVNFGACSKSSYFKGVSNHFLLIICIAVSHRTILFSKFCDRFVSLLLIFGL